MADSVDLSWVVTQRFEFIEWRAYWVGRVNRKDLEDEFSISTQQASVDLSNYREAAPGNIEYDATDKAYRATPNFRSRFYKLAPERYLLQLEAIVGDAIRKNETWFDRLPPADVIPAIVRGPEAFILRAMIQATEAKRAISVNYQSLTNTRVRTICPHAFASDGHRWHVRAWCMERKQFRDFVLGRILSVGPQSDSIINSEDDAEWHTSITLKVIAHPKLGDAQRAAIERDYKLKNGELSLAMRLALAFYFVRRHNLDLREGQIAPERAQLFLQNYDEYEVARQTAKKQASDRRRAPD